MFYAIISRDVKNSLEKRLSVRAEHIARLKTLEDEGRLLIAGLTLILIVKTRVLQVLVVV